MKFNFYYDETEHSREIGYDTIIASNFYDGFITSIVGWNEEKQSEIEQKYLAFEEKYSYRKSKGELKSTTIDNKKLENGFASCNKEYVSFIMDFLRLFNDDIRLYFASISKMEYLINQLFTDYHNTVFVDIDSFKYTIIKALVTNRPVEVEKAIYNNPEQFVLEIKSFLERKIEIDKQNPDLKEVEIKALEDYYSRIKNKLPIDPFSREELAKGFFYNRRGAKCYFDTEKQPILPFPQKENLYHVLSVGFDSNAIPLVTINQDGRPYCYRLPQELSEWAFNAVALANMGENCFPADVIFTKERGRIFVDIL